MRTAIIGLVVLAVAAACGSSGDLAGNDAGADCVDAVSIDGVAFDREPHNDGLVGEPQLAGTIGEVEEASCGRPSDARISSTYLAAGTELREIVGHDAGHRLAAVRQDTVVVYGRRSPGLPSTVFDDVRQIAVLSEFDAKTELGRIDDPEVVDALVGQLDPSAFGQRAPDGWDPLSRVFIGFIHADGLSTQAVYDISTNTFLHGDQPSESWAAEVTAALERAGGGVVEGSSIIRSNGERIPLRLAGSCFPGSIDVTVGIGEALQVEDQREVQYVFGRLYDSAGGFVDSAAIAPPGEGFTSPGKVFEIDTDDPAVSRVIVDVAFLDDAGQPSGDIELCATLGIDQG